MGLNTHLPSILHRVLASDDYRLLYTDHELSLDSFLKPFQYMSDELRLPEFQPVWNSEDNSVRKSIQGVDAARAGNGAGGSFLVNALLAARPLCDATRHECIGPGNL